MFQIRQHGSTVGREVLGGVTTFMAMSYIIFVQAAVLGVAGMDVGGVIMATCIAAGVASILMGLYANYPIAQAPGMGENFFFVFTLCGVGAAAGTFHVNWQQALVLVFCSGVLFLILSFVGFRTYVMNAIPPSIRVGITVGIGLLVTVVGLWYGNIISFSPAPSLVGWEGNHVGLLATAGTAITFVLITLRIPGGILLGMLATGAAGMATGLIGLPEQIAGLPGGIDKTASGFILGFSQLGKSIDGGNLIELLVFVLVLLMMDLFDTVGTLTGVCSQAGLLDKNGALPRAHRALASDAAGTICGAALGTSTVTSYIESAAGVQAGARTGLMAVVVGVLFFAAMFFQPLIQVIAGGVEVAPNVHKYPMIAPALILVGGMMLRSVKELSFADARNYIPAFLTMIIIPMTMSISTGIGAGFIFYALGHLCSRQPRKVPLIVYAIAAIFLAQYILRAWVL